LEGPSILLYRDPDGTRYEIESPPTSTVDPSALATELGLPSYVDLSPSQVQRAVVTIWSCINAPSSLDNIKDRKKIGGPLTPLLFGGAAVKLLSASANEAGGPMNRLIRDVDYVIRRGQGSDFVLLLSSLSKIAGSRYHHFLTSGDRRFNAIRAGDRYRVRCVDWTLDSKPVVGWVDILADRIEMRHKVDVRDEFQRAKTNRYTIGVERLLMSKCQMITEADSKEAAMLEQSGQEFRVLKYSHYREGKVLVGMEAKDMTDVCALLHDIVSEDSGEVTSRLRSCLLNDPRLTLTLRLNVENIIYRGEWLRKRGFKENQISRIQEAGERLLRSIPPSDKKWSRPWWNRDVDTPLIN
jgi:hypothetical protein